eukprot:2599563-Heterocapsa_arctica.AAC.1
MAVHTIGRPAPAFVSHKDVGSDTLHYATPSDPSSAKTSRGFDPSPRTFGYMPASDLGGRWQDVV